MLDLRLERPVTRSRTELVRGSLSVDGTVHRLVIKVQLPGGTARGQAAVGVQPKTMPEPGTGASASATGRPRLYPAVDRALRAHLEAEGLRLVADDLARAPDERLRAVPVLGILQHRLGIVMEEVPGRPLRAMLHRLPLARDGGASGPAMQAAAAAGAWLARYHQLAPELGEPRQATAGEVVDTGARLASWLSRRAAEQGRRGAAEHFRSIEAAFREEGPRLLPERLELGLGHGDFAPRNILVGPDGVVSVLDGWSRWRPPILEDLATFISVTRTSVVQVASGGRWLSDGLLQALEEALFEGYFGARRPPVGAIRIYQLLMLMDRGANIPGVSGPMRLPDRPVSPLRWHRFSAETDRLLRLVRAPTGAGGGAA